MQALTYTIYPHVNEVLDSLVAQLRDVLGEKLVGLHLYGSLVSGDFDNDTSDIDLLAAISSELNEAEFAALDNMHHAFVAANPQWENRLEIAYFTLHGLKTFKTESSKLGIISPGEPFHIIESGIEWLMNWYFVRENGVVLYGLQPASIIAPISKEEFRQAVRDHIVGWREYIKDVQHRGSQAYAILTMCRGLYTFTHGEQVSKLQAALWAEKQLPEWSELILSALVWRKRWKDDVDHAATLPETRRFVSFMIERVFK